MLSMRITMTYVIITEGGFLMFTDPISATIDGSPRSLPRISINGQSSAYKSADGAYSIKVSHQTNKNRTRRLVRLDANVAGTDPLTSVTTTKGIAVYLVVDEPSETVFTDTNGKAALLVAELLTFLSADTAANTAKLLGSEI